MQCDVVFGLNLIIVKGGTHTYNMINDEQLPKKCHEERYRCSNLLEPYRPIVKKIKEETYAQSKAFKRFPNTHQRKSRFGLTKGAGQCFIFWNGMCEKATGQARSPSRPVT